MVKLEMRVVGLPDWQTENKNPNFAKVAEAIGLMGVRIEDPADIRSGLRKALEYSGPALIDVVTDPNALSMPSHRDAEALRSATDTEAEAPSLTGRALDQYAAENAQKLFGKRATVVATVEDVADHIDHAVKIAGIDHVGIGSDFDGIAGTANGLEDVSKMPTLVAVLLKRGYAESDLKNILGENFLRVVREVTPE
jgi:microsomal dipeptidase-like Zn-dependent dipeptidase